MKEETEFSTWNIVAIRSDALTSQAQIYGPEESAKVRARELCEFMRHEGYGVALAGYAKAGEKDRHEFTLLSML